MTPEDYSYSPEWKAEQTSDAWWKDPQIQTYLRKGVGNIFRFNGVESDTEAVERLIEWTGKNE